MKITDRIGAPALWLCLVGGAFNLQAVMPQETSQHGSAPRAVHCEYEAVRFARDPSVLYLVSESFGGIPGDVRIRINGVALPEGSVTIRNDSCLSFPYAPGLWPVSGARRIPIVVSIRGQDFEQALNEMAYPSPAAMLWEHEDSDPLKHRFNIMIRKAFGLPVRPRPLRLPQATPQGAGAAAAAASSGHGVAAAASSATPAPVALTTAPGEKRKREAVGAPKVFTAQEVDLLLGWVVDNLANPYPDQLVKIALGVAVNATFGQINNWFEKLRTSRNASAIALRKRLEVEQGVIMMKSPSGKVYFRAKPTAQAAAASSSSSGSMRLVGAGVAKDDPGATTDEDGEALMTPARELQKRLPPAAVASWTVWFKEHLHHPVPTPDEKGVLLLGTGCTLHQLNVWFQGQRSHHWKQHPSDPSRNELLDRQLTFEERMLAQSLRKAKKGGQSATALPTHEDEPEGLSSASEQDRKRQRTED